MTNLGNIFQTKLTLVRTCTKTTIIYDGKKLMKYNMKQTHKHIQMKLIQT